MEMAYGIPFTDENSQIMDWLPDMDCSMPDSISITYFDSNDPHTRVIVNDPTRLDPIEVRLECHPAGGTDQVSILYINAYTFMNICTPGQEIVFI